MIRYVIDEINPEDYIRLRKRVGFHSFNPEQAKKALDHSLRIIVAMDGNNYVGMGRVVGDGAVICYLQDIIVDPEYHGRKIGDTIVKMLLNYIYEITIPDTIMMIGLMSVSGTEGFYKKMGFIERPNDRFGSGFSLYIEKDGDGIIHER